MTANIIHVWYCPKCKTIQQVMFEDEMYGINRCIMDGANAELYELNIDDLKKIWRKIK